MTAPITPEGTGQLGPGVLKIGATGSEIDVSCLVNNAAIESSKEAAESTTKLCGNVRAGATTYTFQLTGDIDVDAGNESGLFALSWSEPGSEQDFTFTPNLELGTTAKGKLVLDPLRLGADEYGGDLTSPLALDIVGTPTITYAVTP